MRRVHGAILVACLLAFALLNATGHIILYHGAQDGNAGPHIWRGYAECDIGASLDGAGQEYGVCLEWTGAAQ